MNSESIGLGRIGEGANVGPVLAVESKDGALVVAGGVECIIEYAEGFGSFSVWSVARSPLLIAFVAKEAGGLIQGACVEFSAKDGQGCDGLGLWRDRTAVFPSVVR